MARHLLLNYQKLLRKMTSTINLLILEDEEIISESLVEFFSELDYTTFAEVNAENALNQIKEKSIDIVIVDIRLPGQTGFDFIDEASKISPATKYIIHTGTPMDSLPENVLENNNVSDTIFQKPVPNLFAIDIEIRKMLGTEE